jgi:hypothetical protein
MESRRVMVAMAAALVLAACGGGGGEEADAGGGTDTTASPAAPLPPAGTVDTAGVGTNPPTAGGQLVDTAAVPGPADTTKGTATAP